MEKQKEEGDNKNSDLKDGKEKMLRSMSRGVYAFSLLTTISMNPVRHQKDSTSFCVTNSRGDSRSLIPCT